MGNDASVNKDHPVQVVARDGGANAGEYLGGVVQLTAGGATTPVPLRETERSGAGDMEKMGNWAMMLQGIQITKITPSKWWQETEERAPVNF